MADEPDRVAVMGGLVAVDDGLEPNYEVMAADALALSNMTPKQAIERVYTKAAELAEIESKIIEKSRELQDLQDDRNKLAREVLPQLFDHLHTDRLGVPGWKADVVLQSKTHASISKEWPEEDQQAGFAEVERLGGKHLLRVKVVTEFERGEFDLAAEFVRFIGGWPKLKGHAVLIDKTVHWGSLTKFVRELRERRVPMNLKALGATITRECFIKPR